MCSNISSCPFPHISSLLPKTTSLPPPKKLAGYVPDIHIGGAGTKNLTHLNILYTIPLPSILLFFFTLSHQNVLRLYNINLQNLDMATYGWLPKFGCLCPKSLIIAACARIASLAYHGEPLSPLHLTPVFLHTGLLMPGKVCHSQWTAIAVEIS